MINPMVIVLDLCFVGDSFFYGLYYGIHQHQTQIWENMFGSLFPSLLFILFVFEFVFPGFHFYLFIEKVYHHPKEPLFLFWWQRLPWYAYGNPLVLCTSILQRCCCSKRDGHFGQLKKIAFVLGRIKTPRKLTWQWKDGPVGLFALVFCCSFCWVLSTQMSHFCPTKDFQMMLQVYLRLPWKSGPSECGKKSCSALVWPSIWAKIQPWFDR